MNPCSQRSLLAAALVVGCAAAAFGQYSSPPPPPPPPEESAPAPSAAAPVGGVNLPPGLSPDAVQHAIFAALHHRGWTVQSANPGSIVAHLLHHHVDATLTFQYGPTRVDIYGRSYAVGHHPDQRIAPFLRMDWIHNLEHDIARYASRG